MKENDRDPLLKLHCPECGYNLQITAELRSRRLLPSKMPIRYLTPLEEGSQISVRGTAVFLDEVAKRGWSTFVPVTPDIGIDYVIAKEYTSVMIQLKAATKMSDKRYHVKLKKFLEDPLGFVVYYFIDDKTFFLVPFAKFWEVPRFKKLKPKVFAAGEYNDKLSLDKAREVMGNYENEKGWALLGHLETLEGMLQAIQDFVDKQN